MPQATGVTSERCNAFESPSSVVADYTVSPAIVRTYVVQLICKPRAYGSAAEQLPDNRDFLAYANGLLKEGTFEIPDWNRVVIPRSLQNQNTPAK